jgi:hypothetical protein
MDPESSGARERMLAPQSAIAFDSPDSFRKRFVEIAPAELNSSPSAVAVLFTQEADKPSLVTSIFGQGAATDPALYVDEPKDASRLVMLSNPSPHKTLAAVTRQSSTEQVPIPGCYCGYNGRINPSCPHRDSFRFAVDGRRDEESNRLRRRAAGSSNSANDIFEECCALSATGAR